MRITVLQVRNRDDPMLEHERDCFAAATGLNRSVFDWRNVVDGVPSLAEVRASDALLIGGSGHFSVADPSVGFFAPLMTLLGAVVEVGHPTFGSCFGFQLLVETLGGRVVHDADHGEVGAFELELTEEGRSDSLFDCLPDRFIAQLGHLDRAVEVPTGVRILVRSDLCPYQALRVEDAPIWATQFHPELDQEANLHRYRAYVDRYDSAGDDVGFRSLPSPEASRLLPLFLELAR